MLQTGLLAAFILASDELSDGEDEAVNPFVEIVRAFLHPGVSLSRQFVDSGIGVTCQLIELCGSIAKLSSHLLEFSVGVRPQIRDQLARRVYVIPMCNVVFRNDLYDLLKAVETFVR